MGLGRPGGGGAGHRAARLPSRRLEARVQQARPLAAGYPDLPGEASGPVDCCSRCRAAARVRAEPAPASATCHARPTGVHPMALTRSDYSLSQLDVLEAESIHVMREVAAEFERPVLLFSGGKDSVVMLALAERAFSPAKIPFPVMHVDTGHNFPEVMDFRDRRVAELGVRLVVASVQDSIDAGRVAEETGRWASRNRLQTVTLLDAIEEHRFDAVFGGARRDEEKARAKERVYSFRDDFGQWDPKNQRPELWNLYNGRHKPGEHIRVFPLSNWTELDVWQYIGSEKIKLPSIYYAHRRKVFARDGMLLAVHRHMQPRKDEQV